MKTLPIIIITFLILGACTSQPKGSIEEWKAEVVKVEKQFAQMVAEKGIAEGFLAFAADDAVQFKRSYVIEGIDAIRAKFKASPPNENAKLEWAPDFVDVAASGDLAYTYGKYTFSLPDSLGIVSESTGIFHTVWKRQPDGNWKFVWD